MQNWLEQHSSVFFVLFPLFFVGMWLLVTGILSYVGGWTSLAERYRAESEFKGNRWHMQSGRMRWSVNYGNCLTIGSSTAGLYLAVFPLFRFKHPPLLVPWEQISFSRQSGLLFEYVEFRLGRELGIPLRVRAKLGDDVKAAAEGQFPIETLG